jgi:hypothetical protein
VPDAEKRETHLICDTPHSVIASLTYNSQASVFVFIARWLLRGMMSSFERADL